MSASDLELNIRNAQPDDFPVIGKLNALAFAGSHLDKTLVGDADPDEVLEWEWVHTAAPRVASGRDAVLVLERSDTKEMVGFVWFWAFNEERKPVLPAGGWSSAGFHNDVSMKISKVRFAWQNELLNEFGEFMWIREFSIAPSYQSQGLGKKLLRHVVTLAEEDRLRVALMPVEGSQGFFKKCGFNQVGSPVMYGPNDSLKGFSKMLFEPEAKASAQA